jgi:hypothetical protein
MDPYAKASLHEAARRYASLAELAQRKAKGLL